MSKEIFRKKSLDKLKSPESLDECIKVINPGMWLILVAVILLFLGGYVWGALGHIDSICPVSVYAENGAITGTITEENSKSVKTGMAVNFAEFEATIESIRKGDDGYILTLSANETVPDGFYDGNIVIGSFNPISFISY